MRTPSSPYTPRMFDGNGPPEFGSPPGAPFELALGYGSVVGVPSGRAPRLPDILGLLLGDVPGDEVPGAPAPPALEPPYADEGACCCGAAIAWIVTLSGISCLSFSTALSNWMASIACSCPFIRADACVTWPINFVPFGRITLRYVDFTVSVVCAVICSPGFAFFESRDELSVAFKTVPPARDASLPVFSEGVGACAAKPAAKRVVTARLVTASIAAKGFIKANLL